MSDTGYSMLGAGAWGWPTEMLWGGRWEGDSCLGTHVRIKDFKIKKIKIKNKRCLLLRRKATTNIDSRLKSRDITLPTRSSSQSYGFSSSHVWMWELDYKDSWAVKNWCFWIVMLEKILESPSDWKKTKSVNSKGNQPWILIGKSDAEAPILWPFDAENWLIGQYLDAEKGWRKKEKGLAED